MAGAITLGPTLETARLILRPPTAADFDAVAKLLADEVVMRFLGGVQVRPVAWRSFVSTVGSWPILRRDVRRPHRGEHRHLVREAEPRVGPIRPEGWPGTEVGWALARAAWGQGYAVEAASAAMDFAVDVLGCIEIIHCIDAENQPSRAVAARLGSTLLRQDRLPAPIDEDIDIWGQTADDWRRGRASA